MWTLSIACAATGLAGAGCGDGDSGPDASSSPSPGPAFYLTAANTADLRHQAYDAGAHFAREQKAEHGFLMLDFGAARRRGDTWGAALRSGTFFSNDEIRGALESAAKGYSDKHRQGEVTIVYVNTNANLSDPGGRFRKFDRQTAHEAGEQQATALQDLDLPDNVSVALGGDIEPGFDLVGPPEISAELVAGADSAAPGSYYNVGTAPCIGDRCVNGWKIDDICAVTSGGGRQAVPEVYFPREAPGWARVQDQCKIDSFPGVSASPFGDLSPKQSWRHLREEAGVDVGAPVAVWPG